MLTTTRRTTLGAALAMPTIAPALAQAAGWPNRPVRIIVPFAPGGSADTLGRSMAAELTTALGQSFVVENRAGAGGVLGSQQVSRAAPDGYTFVISGIASHVIAPAINANTGFDGLRDFTHVAILGGPPCVLVVNPTTMPVRDVAEFVARGRREPISYSTPGTGTHGHLFAVALGRASGARLEHVPYRGAGAGLADLLSGIVPASSGTLSSVLPPIRAGNLRALALTSATRFAGLPDVPTYPEAGFPDLVGQTWFGLAGPPGLPEGIVTDLNREVVKAMNSPRIRERMETEAMQGADLSAPDYTRFVAAEIAKWAPIARSVNMNDG